MQGHLVHGVTMIEDFSERQFLNYFHAIALQ